MKRGPKPKPIAERFWSYITKGRGNACWKWNGPKVPHGYGVLYIAGSNRIGAHRFSWQLSNGDIPSGLFVCHSCDNPECCNPAHLFLGTQLDNMRDASKKKRCKWNGLDGDSHYMRKRTHCKHGHPFDDSNTLWLPNGSRQCRICNREGGRRWREQHPSEKKPKLPNFNKLKTSCAHGHPFNEHNTYWHNNKRHCKACKKNQRLSSRSAGHKRT